MLDKNFIAMANFLTLAAVGECGRIPDDTDISAVLKYATEHAVFPLVVSGIEKNGKHPEVAVQFLSLSLQLVAKNIQNGYIVKEIFDSFKKEGIEYAVLKGESIASLYIEPDLRLSGDVDLLVSQKCEKKALKILGKFGYYYHKRDSWFNETIAKHDKYKTIEVHTALFDETRKDIFFMNMTEEPQSFMEIDTANYGRISTLAPDDGIMFVFLHFVKHFLSAGAGVRQLLDVIVYSMHYFDDINWEKFFTLLKQIKYYNIYTYIVSIATEYLGISKNKLPDVEIDRVSAEKVFEDLQAGGAFGHNEKELEQFKMVYERKRYDLFLNGDYDLYKNKYKKPKLKLIFPELSYMKGKYPYVARVPALVVVAWIERILKAGIKFILRKRKASEYIGKKEVVENSKIADRMKLMEELGLI